jgi:hypothetical protein
MVQADRVAQDETCQPESRGRRPSSRAFDGLSHHRHDDTQWIAVKMAMQNSTITST